MRSTEIDQFEQQYGYKPTEIRTCYDALAVYVHKDNPLEELTLAQVEAIFAKSRKRGYKQNVTTWGQLGLTGDWADRPISLYGRNSASGTYGFFKEHVLKNGDYKDTVKEQPGSASVVQGVTEDRYAHRLQRHRLPHLRRQGRAACRSSPRGRSSRRHLRRRDERQVSRWPASSTSTSTRRPASPSIRCPLEFLKLVLSKEGQEVVVKDGYLPLTPAIVKEELAKITGTLAPSSVRTSNVQEEAPPEGGASATNALPPDQP